MTDLSFERLLQQARDAHAEFPALSEFCDFPSDLTKVEVQKRHLPCAELMEQDATLIAPGVHPFARAFLDASPHAFWRETYKETNSSAELVSVDTDESCRTLESGNL